MAKQSLFSILARQPWWASVVIAAILFSAARLVVPDIIAVAAMLPFLGVAGYVAWRELRTPGTATIDEALEKIRGMSWDNFSAVTTEAFRRDGYEVAEIASGIADLELRRNGTTCVVSCKRWKVAQTGIGPLRELHQAAQARDECVCIYVSAGEFTGQARKFANEKSIQLLHGAALGKLVTAVSRGKRRWMLWK